MEKVKIKINIAGRFYPLTVAAEEEEVLRNAGKMINEKIQQFEKSYAVQDKQDALAMAALQVSASHLGQKQHESNADEDVQNRLENLLYKLQETTK